MVAVLKFHRSGRWCGERSKELVGRHKLGEEISCIHDVVKEISTRILSII